MINRLLTVSAVSCFLAAASWAQNAPNAIVVDGELVINPGTENEIRILPPAGSVDSAGNLVIGDQTITRPSAVILEDGSLDLGEGVVLPVPSLPTPGGSGVEFVFGDTIVPLDPGKTAETDGWYFSYNFKEVYHWGATFPDFISIRRLGSIFYVITEGEAVRTIDEGVWMYAFDFPIAGNNTWVFMRNGGGLRDLRDRSGGGSLTGTRITGTIYIFSPEGPGSTPGWFSITENSAMTSMSIAPVGTNDFITVWTRSN